MDAIALFLVPVLLVVALGLVITWIIFGLLKQDRQKDSTRDSRKIYLGLDRDININVKLWSESEQHKITKQIDELRQIITPLAAIPECVAVQESRIGQIEKGLETLAEAVRAPQPVTESQNEDKELLNAWRGRKRDEFMTQVANMGYKFETLRNLKDDLTGRPVASENVWIVSKGDTGYVFPAWDSWPGAGLSFYYAEVRRDRVVKDIKQLAKVTFKGDKWELVSEKGELGD